MTVQKRRNWLASSPEYVEFVGICEKNNWRLRPHLPRRGELLAKELDKFMEKGLGPPDRVAFSRAQVNAKFTHWKNSFREPGERRLIEEDNVESIEKILDKLEEEGLMAFAPNVKRWDEDTPKLSSYFFTDPPCDDLWNILKSLRDTAIVSINEALTLDTGQSASYAATASAERRRFERAWADYVISKIDSTIEVDRHHLEAFGANVARVVVRKIHQAIMLGKENSLSAKVTKICSVICDDTPLVPEANHRRETLYYITGWLLCAAGKQAARRKKGSCLQNTLTELVTNASATDDTEISSLPTRKVTDAQLHEAKLKFPSTHFFNFVAVVEKVCETLLLEQNLVIHGPGIVKDIAALLQEESAVLSRLKKCIGLPDLDDACLRETAGCLINSYMNMRGKDYVRTILGASVKADTVGHRSKMQLVSKMGGKSKGVNANSTGGVCFFCGIADHYANACSKRTQEPTIGELQRTTSVGPKAIVWYWCNKCRKWQCHSTEDHKDTEADVEDVEDIVDDVDDADDVEELRQTILDGYHEMDAIVGSLDEDRMGSSTEG
jgi:hypothetical protein